MNSIPMAENLLQIWPVHIELIIGSKIIVQNRSLPINKLLTDYRPVDYGISAVYFHLLSYLIVLFESKLAA